MTVLGSSCSIPRPGRACSSYLLEFAGRAIVLDLGSGSFSNLLHYRSAESVDAVIVSHMHADHFLDVIPMRYALTYGVRTNDRKIALYVPPGGDAILREMVRALPHEPGDDFLGAVYDVRVYDPTRPLLLRDATFRFAPTRHYVPTFAIRCEVAGASVTYSGDTAPCGEVSDLARACGLFVCETTLAPAEEKLVPRGHSSAREAGAMAARADVERLVLTHYPASADLLALEADARATYGGPIAIADDRDRFAVGRAGG